MKTFQTISVLVLVLGVFAIVIVNCSKPNCDSCTITEKEEALIVYKGGEVVIFKNDSTGNLDTLTVHTHLNPAYCSNPCSDASGSFTAELFFTQPIEHFLFSVYHGDDPTAYPTSHRTSDFVFHFNMPTQAIKLNNILYKDVLITSINSSLIPTNERNSIPWQLYFSRSKGFIRLKMVDGSNWDILN